MTHQDQVGLENRLRRGPVHRKAAVFGEYLYSSSRIEDTVSLDGGRPTSSPATPRIIGYCWARRIDIRRMVERRLQGFGYNEDVTLGFASGLSYGRAFLPDFNRHYYDLLTGEFGWTGRVGPNIVSAAYVRSHWLKEAEELRRVSVFDVLWYNNGLSFVTLAVRSHYESDRGGYFQRLVLGGKNGLRGYPAEFSAGNRLHTINTEARFFTGLELLSVKLGAALFGDIGRTWLPGEAVAMEGYH
jgi:hypothetical protein